MAKKKPIIKVKKAAEKAVKVAVPVISEADKWKKKMDEATDPNKKIEYRYWMEYYQGENPEIPPHMRG